MRPTQTGEGGFETRHYSLDVAQIGAIGYASDGRQREAGLKPAATVRQFTACLRQNSTGQSPDSRAAFAELKNWSISTREALPMSL